MKKIVCLGDSLTYGFGVRRALVWTSLVTAQGEVTCINQGINGDTTGGMLARFSNDVEALQPKAVLLMGGANDIILGAGAAVARSNMAAMSHRAVARGIVPLIGIPIRFSLPVREDWASLADFTALSAEYDAYAAWLLHFCSVFGFCGLDFRSLFAAAVAASGAPASTFYLDGLHPNAQGHEIFARVMNEALGAYKKNSFFL